LDTQLKPDPATAELVRNFSHELLELAGVRPRGKVTSLQSKLAQTTKVPDGLLQDQPDDPALPADYYLLELASYAESRVPKQMLGDLAHSYGICGDLPEAYVLLLRPHAHQGLEQEHRVNSRQGSAWLGGGWTSIRLFERDVEDLLAHQCVAYAPFLFVARSERDPVELAEAAVALVQANTTEMRGVDLLAICQVLARFQYNDPRVFATLGGMQVLQESPLFQEFTEKLVEEGEARGRAEGEARGRAEGEARGEARGKAESVVSVLRLRFPLLPVGVEERILAVQDQAVLEQLLHRAVQCPGVPEFLRGIPGPAEGPV